MTDDLKTALDRLAAARAAAEADAELPMWQHLIADAVDAAREEVAAALGIAPKE